MGKYYKFLGDFVTCSGGTYGGFKVGQMYDYDGIIPHTTPKSDEKYNTVKFYVEAYPSDWEEVNEDSFTATLEYGGKTFNFVYVDQDEPPTVQPFERAVWDILHDVGNMLVEKNKKYGNSALAPSNIFSKLSALDSIKVRIDDKLSRIKNGSLDEDEDVTKDLIGYLILYRIEKYGKGNS